MVQIRNKTLKSVLKKINYEIEEYKETHSSMTKRDWKEYEYELYIRTLQAIQGYEYYIEKAIKTLNLPDRNSIGRPNKLTLKQKCVLLLTKQLINKSNREMALLTLIFSALNGINISYKTIERLYSDDKVNLVLNQLHRVILNMKIDTSNIEVCGDGTGYSLTISKHYASEAQKLKNKLKEAKGQCIKKAKKKKLFFVYAFQLLDIKARKYISFGTSFKSEQKAFYEAMKMAKELGISISSIRLDKYYSKQMYVNYLSEFNKDMKFFLIPQKNATIKGCNKWKNMLSNFVENTQEYLGEYFKRNNSENCFSEDKRRFGSQILQKRLDRINTVVFCKVLWHNLFWIGKRG